MSADSRTFDVIYAAVHVAGEPTLTAQVGCALCPRGLPWTKEGGQSDMRWFMSHAAGRAVIVGRKTAELLKRSITGARTTIVLTTSHEGGEEFRYAPGLDEALEIAREAVPDAPPLVIGGASVIAQALPHPKCRRVYHTQISPAHRACDHAPEHQVFTPHYGPIGLAAAGFHVVHGPKVADDNVFRVYERADGAPPATQVVLLYGPIGAGKSTVARRLREGGGWATASLADPLKDICAKLLVNLRPDLSDKLGRNPRAAMERRMIGGGRRGGATDWRERPLDEAAELEFAGAPSRPLSVRTLLQFVGTEVLRPALGDGVFSRALCSRLGPRTVVDDLRFVDEYAEIAGEMARRPEPYALTVVQIQGETSGATHRSETEQARFAPDLVLRNAPEDHAGATAAAILAKMLGAG